MIFITARFRIRPEDAGRWPEIAGEFINFTVPQDDRSELGELAVRR